MPNYILVDSAIALNATRLLNDDLVVVMSCADLVLRKTPLAALENRQLLRELAAAAVRAAEENRKILDALAGKQNHDPGHSDGSGL